MRNYYLTQKEGVIVAKTKHALYSELFGSVSFPRYLSIVLVVISILMATCVVHEGWFPTSQSQGMTNFHRWLYDVYVILSLLLIPFIYIRFIQLKTRRSFRRKWNAYIRAYAQHHLKLSEVIESVEGDRLG